MAKGLMYAKDGVLQGIFTNKKNLWEDLEKTHGDVSELMMKLNPTKPTDLTYPKLVKHLGDRKMLSVYLKEDIKQSIVNNDIESCVPTYKMWEVEMNEHFKPDWVKE